MVVMAAGDKRKPRVSGITRKRGVPTRAQRSVTGQALFERQTILFLTRSARTSRNRNATVRKTIFPKLKSNFRPLGYDMA